MQLRRLFVTTALVGTLALGCESEVTEPLAPATKKDPVIQTGDPPRTAHVEVRAGGQIREGDWKISFGGQARADGILAPTGWAPWSWMAWEADGELVIRFHNVAVPALSGKTFKSTDVMDISFRFHPDPGSSCVGLSGVTAVGSLDGEPGWVVWFSVADVGKNKSPGRNRTVHDHVRMAVWGPGDHPDSNLIAYDTDRDGFPRATVCGGKKTPLDSGNIKIDITY